MLFRSVVLCALFWKRANKYGAFSGMFVGGAMVFVWKYLIAPIGASNPELSFLNIYELLPSFLAGLIVIIVVSLLTKKPSQDIVDTFEEVKKMN